MPSSQLCYRVKLPLLSVSDSTCRLITDFLSNRRQQETCVWPPAPDTSRAEFFPLVSSLLSLHQHLHLQSPVSRTSEVCWWHFRTWTHFWQEWFCRHGGDGVITTTTTVETNVDFHSASPFALWTSSSLRTSNGSRSPCWWWRDETGTPTCGFEGFHRKCHLIFRLWPSTPLPGEMFWDSHWLERSHPCPPDLMLHSCPYVAHTCK